MTMGVQGRSVRASSRAMKAIWALAAACLMAAGSLVAAHPAGAAVTVTGTGSSYAAVAINNWVGQVANILGLSINYQTQSSVLGLDAFALGQVDFGASEIGYSAGQSSPPAPPAGEQYQYLPSVAGAICLMYNLPSATQQPIENLQLTPGVLQGIYSGAITKWNDPQIASINPGVALPDHRIVADIRSDASGDNYIFSWYLSQADPSAWQQFMDAVQFAPAQAGNPRTAIWPMPVNGSSAKTSAGLKLDFSSFNASAGSDNASNYVAANPYSMTYVETAYAILQGKPCAAIQNASGSFVQPSSEADATALKYDKLNASDYYSQDLHDVFAAPDSIAYPISAYSYLVTQTAGLSPAKGEVLGKFIAFLACQGQVSAGQLGYAPLPPELVQVDFQAITRLPGAPAPPPLDADHCKNPYLTGSATYVGGPAIAGQAPGSTSITLPPGALAQVKTATPEQLAQAIKKKHGVLEAAGGQQLGVALNAETQSLLKLPVSWTHYALLTALFLAIIVAPPLIALVVRRRGRANDREGDL
jgi:phosphate transport system substrate-binding protein